MVVFLIISTLLSALATGIIVFNGLVSTGQKTSTTTRASQDETPTLKPLASPTPTAPTVSPIPTLTPTPQTSPTPTLIKVIISPYITATTSSNKKSVFINFFSLADTKSALYKLNYSSDGGDKGASGNIVFASEAKTSREIILGVCSGDVCTYDSGVKNMKIEVTFTQKDSTTSKITYPYVL